MDNRDIASSHIKSAETIVFPISTPFTISNRERPPGGVDATPKSGGGHPLDV